MNLTPEIISHCKSVLQIQNDFVPGDSVIGQHTLFEQWRQKTQRLNLPKLIFYIIMNEEFGMPKEVDSANNLGYRLTVKGNEVEPAKTTDNA